MSRSTELDRRLRAEMRAERRAQLSRGGLLRKRIGWAMCIVGVLLFVAGAVGAASGLQVLPFDRHHVISQFGGVAIAMLGLAWATR